ncbi:tetratricopeptide repeat protein [Alphaproteobacteria bacterium]|nr:tetratricopeptide repeat protein [Alphaproteobacteria bacterium]
MKDLILELNKILSNYAKGNKYTAYQKLKKILNKYPSNEKIYFNLAIMEQDLGLHNQAKISYKKLIENYNSYKAKMNLYLLYIKEQDYLSALKIINKFLNSELNDNKILLDKAYILLKINKLNECLKICKSIISKDKESLDAINLIGKCFLEENKYKEAEEILLRGIAYKKNNVTLLNSLGKLYFEIWNLEKSEYFYHNALKENSKSYQTLNNIGGFYLETNRSDKALVYYLRALEIVPNEPTILNNLAKTYLSLKDIKNAEKYCLMAIKIKEEDSFKKILSIINFHKMDFKKAWSFFDGRLGLNDFVKKNKSYELIKAKLLKKRKINPNKKLLIIREQGVGDEILYGSIYEDLLNTFDNTIIETDQRLLPLFINSFDNIHKNKFVKLGYYSDNNEKLKDFEQVLYAGSLGYYFRKNLDDFPEKNYLTVSSEEINKGKVKLDIYKKKFKIGLSWKSFNNLYANQKSLSLIDFEFLINNKNFDTLNMQYGNVLEEIKTFNNKSKSKIHVLNNLDLFNDFIKVASVLKNIDLFITVSNSTAHLAGALGVKTLLIKPFNQATFHYWNQPNNRTPWYRNIDLIDRDELLDEELFKKKIFSKLS